MINKSFFVTYISLIVIIIWDAVWTYIFEKSSGGNTGFILFFFILLVFIENIKYYQFRKGLFEKPIIYWVMWATIAGLNTFLDINTPAENRSISILLFLFIPVLIIMIIQQMNISELKKVINVFIFALIFKTFISLIFDSFGNESGGYRFGAEYNSNMIAFCVIILYLINLIKITLFGNNKWLSIFILILTIVILIMTASRKSTIAFLIIIIGQQFIFSKENKIKNYIKKFIFLTSLIAGISWGLNNTEVGERIVKTAEQTINANEDEERFDGRLVQYVEGYKVFKSEPLLGIGLFNYRYIDRFGLELHSEYLVQLVESGLIGILLFSLFYGYIIYNLFKVNPKSKLRKTSNILILSFLVYGVLFLGTWVYNMSMFWIIIGLAIKIIRLDKQFLEKNIDSQKLSTNTANKF